MERRTLMRLLGAATVSAGAGCSSMTDGDDESSTPAGASPADTQTETPMTTETPTPDDGAGDSGLVTVTAEGSVEETVARIENDIEASPLTLVTTVDHAANAAAVDMDLPPTTLLLFGNPEIGTPLMQASRSVAIDLPQKLLVWADEEEVKVTYTDPQYLARRHGIDDQAERLQQISTVLRQLATGQQ